jgi:hypothetical protein
MRHYGVPTRLLDWANSIFVAAYNAASKAPRVDGAIYILSAPDLFTSMRTMGSEATPLREYKLPTRADLFLKEDALPLIHLSKRSNALIDRMIAQQGVFMASENAGADIEDVLTREIQKTAGQKGMNFIKLRIPAQLKPTLMRRLRAMNVTANVLFPGLDGIGRHLDDLVRNP